MQSLLVVALVFACIVAVARAVVNDYHIYWNVTVFAPKVKKEILHSVIGCTKKGSLHAILGPSGIIRFTFSS